VTPASSTSTSALAHLVRLGVEPDPPPTLDTLSRIHRAHVERVPYENLGIMLGRPPSVDPAASLARVATTGRAGYCFHQNGAIEVLLRELGFDVVRRHGHVWGDRADRHGTALNHLVLEVTGLPTDDNPSGRWWPDLGLGEGFLDPLPLVVGSYVDGPLTFTIDEVRDDGWTFTNATHGSFVGLEVRPLPSDDAEVAAAHALLSTPPDGAFTGVLVVQRRSGLAKETVRGCVHTRMDLDGIHTTDLTSYDAWRDALAIVGLPLDDIDPAELRALWERLWVSHQAWDASGRP
jgi:N-hydroxyarylamine O-acetyltransferase